MSEQAIEGPAPEAKAGGFAAILDAFFSRGEVVPVVVREAEAEA